MFELLDRHDFVVEPLPDLIVDPLAAEAPALTELTESRLPGAVVTLHPSTGRLAAL